MPEFSPVLKLSSLNGTNGFRLAGQLVSDVAGYSVHSAGDVNGDGFADVIVGAYRADPHGSFSGSSYVVFGKASGFTATINLSALNGSNGFRLDGVATYDSSGKVVSKAGDVNGDGFDDVIIGAPGADPSGDSSGSSYVVFGKAGGFAAAIDLSSLNGVNGFRLDGLASGDISGIAVSAAGDVNGDGIGDLLIGAANADQGFSGTGSSYVVFGQASGFGSSLSLSTLNGTNGFRIDGAVASTFLGASVSEAGDINGDGFDDVIVGAVAGASYVVFGQADGFAAAFDVSQLNGATGFRLVGGRSVGGAGDVNGDGFDDLIVGASFAAPNGPSSGSVYVVFGGSAFGADVQLSALDGSNGFRIDGLRSSDYTGAFVSDAGDVNGDGFSDVLISALGFDRAGATNAGAAFVVFGRAGGFAPVIKVGALNGNEGFRIDGVAGGDKTGTSVSAAGDVNGDGFDDLIVGAGYADPNGADSGAAYVVFGHRAQSAVDRVGTDLDNRINGGTGDDTIAGLSGNDTLVGWEGDDTINGGDGDDTIETGLGVDIVDGGAGTDTLDVDRRFTTGIIFTLNGAPGSDGSRAINVERMTYLAGPGNDIITGAGGNDSIYGGDGSDILNGAAGNDYLDGGNGSDVLRSGAGADNLNGGAGTDTASYYTSTVGVVVSLTTQKGTGGDAQGDTFYLIETVSGSQGNDSLVGDADANTLQGWNGDDVLAGGRGKDTLFGYAGADRFVFGNIDDSAVGANADRITDFSHAQGDRIDLSAIDANAGVAGDQAFTFIGPALYTGVAGQLRCASDGVITAIGGDINGDGVSDFHIRLTGQVGLTAADFAL